MGHHFSIILYKKSPLGGSLQFRGNIFSGNLEEILTLQGNPYLTTIPMSSLQAGSRGVFGAEAGERGLRSALVPWSLHGRKWGIGSRMDIEYMNIPPEI